MKTQILPPPPLLVGIEQSCALLGSIPRSSVYELINAGKLHRIKLGRRTLFHYSDLVALADDLRAERGEQDAA